MLELRQFIEQLTARINRKKTEVVVLTDEEWAECEAIVKVLKIPYQATLQMQAVQYTLSDFFATWMDVKIKLRTCTNSQIAENILKGMESREQKKFIINSPPIYACVYLDGRYRTLLESSQKLIAIEHLKMIYRKLMCEDKPTSELVPDTTEGIQPSQFNSLKEYLIEREKRKERNSSLSRASEENICRRIKNIMPDTTNLERSTLSEWYRCKDCCPVLYKLACVVNCAAPTQTSVEGGFSSLSFILNPYRSQLSDERINNILILRLNKSLINLISID